jgi:hypothetical protein
MVLHMWFPSPYYLIIKAEVGTQQEVVLAPQRLSYTVTHAIDCTTCLIQDNCHQPPRPWCMSWLITLAKTDLAISMPCYFPYLFAHEFHGGDRVVDANAKLQGCSHVARSKTNLPMTLVEKSHRWCKHKANLDFTGYELEDDPACMLQLEADMAEIILYDQVV